MRDDHAKPSLILCRGNESAHHPAIVTRLSHVQDVQPERLACPVGISSQITKVLRQYKRRVVLRLLEPRALNNTAQHYTATLGHRRAIVENIRLPVYGHAV